MTEMTKHLSCTTSPWSSGPRTEGTGYTTSAIVPAGATGNSKVVLGEYARWLESTGRTWHTPDLAVFRDYLLGRDEERQYITRTGKTATRHYGPIAPKTLAGMLSTVRARIRAILDEDETRERLRELARVELERRGEPVITASIEALAAAAVGNITRAIDPKKAEVKVTKRQDRTAEQVGVRLTREQASALLASPGTREIERLRDTAILAVFLCTGIREQELCDLEARDLREKNAGGDLCINVRHGKGDKQRLIPWGAGQWALAVVDKWLETCSETQLPGMSEGAVFRGFYKGNKRLRRGKLTARAIQKIVAKYPVMVDGELTTVHPHDLRRTYAARCRAAGMDILGIQQNLGHADHLTTLRYIGEIDGELRRPPALYSFDLSALDAVTWQRTLPSG